MLSEGPLDSSSPPASARPLPREFGGYELLSEIARGGMGIVYRARQIQLNRTVALKVMASGQFAAPDFVKRFRTEAEAVARLDHPNIVPIHEVGESEGQPFFSMKLVEEGSLAQRIANRKAPLSNHEAAHLILKLAGAVHYAHQRGILHRDLKPANVLLDAQGEPFLTDFGLARLVEKDSTLTRTMAMLGTPSYMSPEQARGEAKQLTTAVDVYGLGALFYELLAGQPPFAGGTTMETVRQVLDQEPRRPASLRAEVDRDLETICLKCLEKEPARRYGSAEALGNDLERWLNHEPILARPATTLERAAKLVRRHPMGTAFTGAILLIIAVSVAMLARANVHIRRAQGAESILRDQAERKAEESRQQLIRLNVGTGNRLVDEGDYLRALLWFSEALRLENGDAAREDVHRRRLGTALRLTPELAQIWFHDGIVTDAHFNRSGDRVLSFGSTRDVHVWDIAEREQAIPALKHEHPLTTAKFSPDGRRIVTLDSRRQLRFWDATTGELLQPPNDLLRHRQFKNIEFSPDGQWMALASSNGVQLFNAASGASGPLLDSPGGAGSCRFAPSGRLLVTVQKREAGIWTLVAGEWSQRTVSHSSEVWHITFSHDEKWMAATTSREIVIWDVATGALIRSIPSAANLYDCQFSPDGRWIALASWARNVRLFGTDDFQERTGLVRHRTGVSRSRFSADSRRLATCSWDFTARLWNPDNGEPVSPWLLHGGYVLTLSFSPDSSRLITAGQDHTVRLWNLRTNDGARLKVRHEQSVEVLHFSLDGGRLFSAGRDRRANIWDAQSGRLLLALPRHSHEIYAGGFSPDGRAVATVCESGLRLWNSQTGQQIGSTLGADKGLNSLEFIQDGKRIVSSGADGSAYVWNVADGSLVSRMRCHKGAVTRIRSSIDGRLLTTGEDGVARLWNADTGEPIGQPLKLAGKIPDADFSPDGRQVVTACNDDSQAGLAARIWDAATGQSLGIELPHLDGILCVDFSPDGKLIATGGEDRVAIVWDGATGRRLTPGMPHPSFASKVKFSPDSRLLLTYGTTGSGGGFARVWEAVTGEPVTPPLLHRTVLTEGAWSPDGQQVVLGEANGDVTFWDVSGATGSVESLQRQAQTLSAHRLEPNHGVLPLTAKEVQERWEAARRRQP